MEKINIAELLKDCPSGMELDCTMFNDIAFNTVEFGKTIIVTRTNGTDIHLDKYGTFSNGKDAKCVIFPKGKTSWEGFVPPCKFKDGDVVATDSGRWLGIIKNKYDFEYYTVHCAIDYTFNDVFYRCGEYCFSRLATEEEKAKLFQAIENNGYRWNPETKTLEKLPKFKIGDTISNGKASITINYIDSEYYCEIGRDFATKLPIKNQDEWELISEKFPNRFNVNTLVPFESKVLVRNDESQYWIPAFWGCKRADGYATTFGWCKYCIPFEGNEHLLETNNDCNEYYKTWK